MSLISETVGNNMTNEPEDVMSVKDALGELDRFEEEQPHGYITRDLDDSIRGYQRDNGLREDGVLFPGGETENALIGELGGDEPPVPERKPTSPETESEDDAPKEDDDDCSGLEVALENARSILEQAQTALDTARTDLGTAINESEKISAQLAQEKKEKKKAAALGRVVGFGGGAAISKNFAISEVSGRIGSKFAPIVEELFDAITDEKTDFTLSVELSQAEEKISELEAKVEELELAVQDAQEIVSSAEQSLENCLNR